VGAERGQRHSEPAWSAAQDRHRGRCHLDRSTHLHRKPDDEADALIDKAEKLKAAIRAKVEHPFRVIRRQVGFVKVRYRGLAKNMAQLKTLFALSNLWLVRRKLMGAGA
jgi:IS5 family transposase